MHKTSIWCQKILICVEHIEKSYKLIFPLFPIRKYIDDIYIYSTHVSGFKSGYIQVDLYILPKNIKQVFSAFADQHSRNLRKFYMGVVYRHNNDIMYSF